MRIGIDDTDAPDGMCTTYLGAVLSRELAGHGFRVGIPRLLRLNPNVPWKTRGNAAICIEAEGDPEEAFRIACGCVDELAVLEAEATHPGVAVVEDPPDPAFYRKALQDFCTVEEAREVLEAAGARSRGWKLGRGLIGAAAAVSADLPDTTWELLAYRTPARWGTGREIDPLSFFLSEDASTPHTWDTVDRSQGIVVCSPHTPDPVLFGIRGESPWWVTYARSFLVTEPPWMEQLYLTNQSTDAHLREGRIGALSDGRSYRVPGMVAGEAETGPGGHVTVPLEEGGTILRCMAYEPTKEFRDVVRALRAGDRVQACGSYKRGSLNLEKIRVISVAEDSDERPPVCGACGKRMTSAGTGKGYKCPRCGARARNPEVTLHPRTLACGWYEVPPCARRHLARPLVRGGSDGKSDTVPGNTL
ncbi:MAG: tRNA(Ile)(2)-agmatinylcytidine synthase [Methanomicrobiales archaeon]|nr:tRNA(Ile)(2)-agmatinylcytidine synthase [Methanomicrobiales archaeon]